MDLGENFPAAPARAEKIHVLPPPKGDHHADSKFVAKVEKPFWRGVIDAHPVHTDLPHQGEIDAGLLGRTHVVTVGIGSEGAIGDTLEKKLVISFEEKLCACAHPLLHGVNGYGKFPH